MSTSREIALLPEVSLVTSWRVPLPQTDPDIHAERLPGVFHALREGIGVLDLYLLEHREIPLYAKITSQVNPPREPQAFLASLDQTALDTLVEWLQKQLVTYFAGRSIGRRPRWGGIATFFPSISAPDCDGEQAKRDRQDAIRALQASLYLAYRLGCPCIEAVGGSRTPLTAAPKLPESYIKERHRALAESLNAVFDLQSPKNVLDKIKDTAQIPGLALELEPGPSFLLNRIEEYGKLVTHLTSSLAKKKVGLNADVAHFFLCGYYRPEDLGEYQSHILHMHLSDHAADYVGGGTHASDLVPGLYHGLADYRPWLELAVKETQRENSSFSGTIAVELEACHAISDVLSAQSTVRRWLSEVAREIGNPAAELPPLRGALLVVDLGNSTKGILGAGDDARQAANKLRDLLDRICTFVRESGGTLLSFTGDGFIGMVEERYFQEETAERAGKIAQELSGELREALLATEADEISLRCALHWGEVLVPNAGALREQAIGRDVVCTARLCDLLSKRIEPALPESQNERTLFAATGQFHKKLLHSATSWELWRRNIELKGLPDRYVIYTQQGRATTT
jgi:class 3 adenylate cyclase/sugar phosphate isomerase/epimerase